MKNINVATNSQIMKFNDLLDRFTSFLTVNRMRSLCESVIANQIF